MFPHVRPGKFPPTMDMSTMDGLIEQSICGAGVKCKGMDFVPVLSNTSQDKSASNPLRSIGDRYLSIVIKESSSLARQSAGSLMPDHWQETYIGSLTRNDEALCSVCNLPLNSTETDAQQIRSPERHELSVAHQVCTRHSYPPSHIDRSSRGLKYLSSYGWDPDGKLGLGAAGAGIRVPVKTKIKNDTVGLGLIPVRRSKPPMVELLDAIRERKRESEERRKTERLHELC